MWKFHRSITRPFFNKERISDFDIFDEHASSAIAQAKDRAAAGYPIEFQVGSFGDFLYDTGVDVVFQDWCARISLDSATAFLFNNDVRSLAAGLPYRPTTLEANLNSSHPSNLFARAFNSSQQQIAFRSFLGGVWSLSEMTKEATEEHMKVVKAFIEPIIEAALLKKKETAKLKDANLEAGDIEDTSLLDHLVKMTDGMSGRHCRMFTDSNRNF